MLDLKIGDEVEVLVGGCRGRRGRVVKIGNWPSGETAPHAWVVFHNTGGEGLPFELNNENILAKVPELRVGVHVRTCSEPYCGYAGVVKGLNEDSCTVLLFGVGCGEHHEYARVDVYVELPRVKALGYSLTPPVRPGWYWRKEGADAMCVRVYRIHERLFIEGWEGAFSIPKFDLNHYQCPDTLWAGPIPEPFAAGVLSD